MKFLERRRSHGSMKRFYNWFHGFYGAIEKGLGPSVQNVIDTLFKNSKKYRKMTAIEYACGSGLLTRKLAKIFKSVEGRDSSANMLARAKRLASQEGANIRFKEGNVLEIKEGPRTYDYVFISFALHLFAEEAILEVLKSMLRVAKKDVIVIDHELKFGPMTAFVEWIEGSYYDQFINLDFKTLAKKVGAKHFNLEEISRCSVMRFSH